MKLHIKFKQTEISSHRCGDDYDASWSIDYDFKVEAASLKRPLVEYETLNIVGPVKNGDTVWVLHVVHSNGDSMGRASGLGEVIWAFTNEQMAKSAADSILKNKNESSFQFGDDDGSIVQMCNPVLCDYFDSLNDVVLTKLVVSENIEYDYRR